MPELISDVAADDCMSFCYASLSWTVAQTKQIISIGGEEVAIGSAAGENPELISSIVEDACARVLRMCSKVK
jgi:imidazole glycerol phosphate synthase subunit HisF